LKNLTRHVPVLGHVDCRTPVYVQVIDVCSVCVCVCVCARARAILAILVSQNWIKVVRGTTPTPNSSEREGAAGIGSVGDGIGEGGTRLCGSLAYISTKKRPILNTQRQGVWTCMH